MMTMVIIGDFTTVSWDITRYNPPVILENCTHFVNCTHQVERWKQCHALSDIRLGSGSCNHHWTPSCLPAREAANKAGVRLNLGSPQRRHFGKVISKCCLWGQLGSGNHGYRVCICPTVLVHTHNLSPPTFLVLPFLEPRDWKNCSAASTTSCLAASFSKSCL